MKALCKKCKLQITNELEELRDLGLLKIEDGADFIPQGFFMHGDEKRYTGSGGKIIINKSDLINRVSHNDDSRLHGCCGLDGQDRINKTCKNGDEVATELSDCWQAHVSKR